jgi:hypothetical protein
MLPVSHMLSVFAFRMRNPEGITRSRVTKAVEQQTDSGLVCWGTAHQDCSNRAYEFSGLLLHHQDETLCNGTRSSRAGWRQWELQ